MEGEKFLRGVWMLDVLVYEMMMMMRRGKKISGYLHSTTSDSDTELYCNFSFTLGPTTPTQ
jgi:hypothetical protein